MLQSTLRLHQAQQSRLRWPAEWEPHAATWLAWPHNCEDWPGKFAPIPWVFAEVIRKLTRHERVHLLVAADSRRPALDCLRRAGVELQRVVYHDFATNRVWTRDYAPFFVKHDQETHGVKWLFNGWAKYDNWQLDHAAGLGILATLPDCARHQPQDKDRVVVLEGGSVDTNGAGTLLTTEECLLGDVQTRNPGFTAADYEAHFAQSLGIRKTIWLRRGIAGDDTHGHVDDLARFVNETTVVLASEEDRGDVNYDALAENFELLQNATTADGQPLRVVKLPMPAPVLFDGQRLPASYANFYIANRQVLVPTFNDPMDRVALNLLADLFPDRSVTGIHALDLVWGLGTLHCMTMQQTA